MPITIIEDKTMTRKYEILQILETYRAKELNQGGWLLSFDVVRREQLQAELNCIQAEEYIIKKYVNNNYSESVLKEIEKNG